MSAEVTTPSGMVGSGTAAPILSSNALPIGTRVHEFEITRVVGEGGFSVVYLAFDHTLHRSIALKEYIPSALASRRGDNTVAVRSAQHQQTFEAGLRSFINEARLLAQFDHPALVKVYRFWESNGTAYMAMPYYEGRTLKQILREHPEQASQEWLERLLTPLLDALELLHRHRCYHRDIAPDNIQVLENEAPVLLDFGAARRTIGDMTQAFTVILKPGYAPIEQYADEADLKQGPWTDVYALSAVLYGAIVRKPPPTAVARVIKDPLQPLAKRALAGYSAAFLSGIDRGLAVRPEDRPQSIAEWRALMGMQRGAAAATDVRSRAAAASGLDVDSRRMAETRGETLHPMPPSNAAPLASAGEVTRAPIASGLAGPPPASPEADVRASPDVSAEKDRTVLVPGLRRTTQRSRSVTAPSEAAAAQSRGAWREPTSSLLRPPVLIGVGVVIVVLIAIVAINATRVEKGASVAEAPPGAELSTPPVITSPMPAPSDANKPIAPTPGMLPANPSPSDTPPPVPPDANKPVTPTPGTLIAKPSPSNTSLPAPPDENKPIPPTPEAPPAQPLPSDRSPPAPPPQKPIAPDDEKEWARIRNSSKLADFMAFQLKFPSSSHSADAAARIKTLERRAQEAARQPPPKPAPPTKSDTQIANLDEGKRPVIAASQPAAPIAPAGKAIVRIHAQPFGYVYVDGTLIGASPPVREVAMSPGKHRIEARNDAARPPVVSTEIDVSGTTARDVRLRFNE